MANSWWNKLNNTCDGYLQEAEDKVKYNAGIGCSFKINKIRPWFKARWGNAPSWTLKEQVFLKKRKMIY